MDCGCFGERASQGFRDSIDGTESGKRDGQKCFSCLSEVLGMCTNVEVEEDFEGLWEQLTQQMS